MKAGIDLAKALGAQVTGLFVTDPTYVRELDEGLNVHSDKVLALFSEQAKLAGIAHECVAVRGATPQDGIMDFAKEKGCDVIVMGSHGRSRVGKFLLGSIAASLLADCDIPVLIYR
ncbi:MAG: universal stress protein [Rhodocyclaceae bacterium]|nr:universal stress protein [Rhodocyclaceae bacterium]